jgi:hypothetical protein
MASRSSSNHDTQAPEFARDQEAESTSRVWLCGRCGAREMTTIPSSKPERCLSCFALVGHDSDFTPWQEDA